MAKKTFISFDYDNDSDLKLLLVGQAKNENTPFEIYDSSVKEELSGDWKEKVKNKLRNLDLMIVICGEKTNTASGVSSELKMAKELGLPYFLLWGRNGKTCTKPTSADDEDKIYEWTWDNLKALINGGR